MKIVTIILASCVAAVAAAPAIVWMGDDASSGPSHVSDAIDAQSLLSESVRRDERESSLAAVVFLVGRDADGGAGLTGLTASGRLPVVRERYGRAAAVYHHVRGLESTRTVARDARRAGGGGVAETTLEDFRRQLGSLAQTALAGTVAGAGTPSTAEQRRRRAIAEADVLVVTAGADDAAELDAAVVAAIDAPAVRTVVLASIRSVDELKHARRLAVLSKFRGSRKSVTPHGRRLEDEANEEEDAGQNQDLEGVYYVNMTPNILAGLMFFFLFAFTAHLGLTCMNMIEGQDVFLVKKYPHNGREA